MEYIENLIEEKSKLISYAEVLKSEGNLSEAKLLYKKAGGIEFEISSIYNEKKSEKVKIHLISAISCALEAENYKDMSHWIEIFENLDDIDKDEVDIIDKIKIMAETKIKYK